MTRFLLVIVVLLTTASLACPEEAAEPDADREAELAKELQNPVAKLISVPVQNNWDFHIGPARALRYTVNVQPVIPFSLTEDWNLITRTILPTGGRYHAEAPSGGPDWGLRFAVTLLFPKR